MYTWRLKARIMEQEEMAAARQQHGKHVSVATNRHATIKKLLEAAFSTRSMLRLCNEGEQEIRQ
jgi:hypothetical protein